MSTADIPLVDLSGWTGTPADRTRIGEAVDRALTEIGFLMITGNGISDDEFRRARTDAASFFHLPRAAKQEVQLERETYRGWAGLGDENTAASYGVATPADLREAFTVGPISRPDDEYHRRFATRFGANRWPGVAPALKDSWETMYRAMDRLSALLLKVFETALGASIGTMSSQCGRDTSTLSANWYPSFDGVETVEEGQFRIGPHTDFGTFTILDRQPGVAGLQVQLLDDSWVDAPWVPGALTVNTGDLMSVWTADRWRSTRHRVLPPDPTAPAEELLSIVYFHEPDADAPVRPLGHHDPMAPLAGQYIQAKLDAMAPLR